MKLKNTFLTLTAIIAMNTALMAQSYRNINGTIKSTFDKKPASYVTVTIAEKNNPINTQTTTADNQGRYTIDRITGIKNETEITIPEGTQSIGIEGEIAYYAVPGDATITIYNLLAQKIKEINQENRTTGIQTVQWNRTNENNSRVASGIYPYTIKQNRKILAGKINVVYREFSGIERTLQKITEQEQLAARNMQTQDSRKEQQRLGKQQEEQNTQ